MKISHSLYTFCFCFSFYATEMSKLFPSIPLVAEEDSGFVRENNLASAVFAEVMDKSSISDDELSEEGVLKAIDRGGKDAYLFGPEPTTYWVRDNPDKGEFFKFNCCSPRLRFVLRFC